MIYIDENLKKAIDSQYFKSLSRLQFKLALLEKGLLDNFEKGIEAIEDSILRSRIKIEYMETTNFDRSNEVIKYMFGHLGLTDEEVDELWEHGMSL